MTSLHQNSRHTNNSTLDTSINNSSSISPVIQRKIDQSLDTKSIQNRKQIEFDTTSIASVSESSHWSGGAGEDLDNVALVNGSDINTMENKDWSTYLRMSKNGYNSSDQDEEEDEEAYSDEDSSLCDDKMASKQKNKKSLKKNSSNDETDDEDLITSKKLNDDAGSEQGEEDEDFDEHLNDDEDSLNDSDEDLDDDDIWTIKPKLLNYYEKQFKTMQPNLNGFILGSVAKPFFERSKLPLNELSKIWELSDVTKDGALSFPEFCTAMHLVVLRVRNFELPNELPPKLQPYAPLIDFNSETSLNNKVEAVSLAGQANAGSIESDDQRPVNFDAKPNSDVYHPVALRAKPNLIPEPPPRHSRSSSLGAVNNFSIPPPPLSQPQQPIQQTNNTPKILEQKPQVPPRITSPPLLPPPPPPPPLPQNYHQSRILSIQNNLTPGKLRAVNSTTQTPATTQSNSSSNQDELLKTMEVLVDRMKGNISDRLSRLNEKSTTDTEQTQSQGQENNQAEVLVESIRHHTEQNQMLRKIFNELEKELRSLTDQRLALEIKLDYLNSKSNNQQNLSATPAVLQTLSINTPCTTKQHQINKNLVTPITVIPNTAVVAAAHSSVSSTVVQTPASTNCTVVPASPISVNNTKLN